MNILRQFRYLNDNKKGISCNTNYLFFDESGGEVYIKLYRVDDTFTYLKFPFFKDLGERERDEE